jgi:hypothetical protein
VCAVVTRKARSDVPAARAAGASLPDAMELTKADPILGMMRLDYRPSVRD